MFIDEARITVRSGKGGRGSVSWRREKYVPRGGPDGGDGGNGAPVILRATFRRHTLLDIMQQGIYAAEHGQPGMPKQCSGRRGRDLILELPVGTVVKDEDTGEVLCDLSVDGQECVVAHGGKGGRGNKAFATATNRTPHEHEEGGPLEERHLYLELKLVADVGFLGLPNAGKSTLLSRLSKARPKVAAYPFTTLVPELGVLETSDKRHVVMADLPGLIEGAHKGIGLGDEFLRHVERTKVLLHLVDVAPGAMKPPIEAYETIRRELKLYSPQLAKRPEVVVATKIDVGSFEENVEALRKHVDRPFVAISAASGQGLGKLVQFMIEELDKCS
jgi:GTP-binding protein